MKKRIFLLLTALAVAICFCMWPFSDVLAFGSNAASSDGDGTSRAAEAASTSPLSAAEMLEGGHYARDELLVTFEKGTSRKEMKNAAAASDTRLTDVQDAGNEQMASVDVEKGQSMRQAIEELQRQEGVSAVQPNYRYRVSTVSDPYLQPGTVGYQYHLAAVRAQQAWAALEGCGHAATVAVVDTGVDITHEDLQASLQDTIRQTGGFVRTTGGEERLTNDDPGYHGTHVAGIIGATYGNGKGGAGVASGSSNDLVRILPVGISDDGESMYTYDIVNGIRYAVQHGAEVINLSLGSYGQDLLLDASVEQAHDAGVVVVAAAGNDSASAYSCPGDNSAVIDVMATGSTDEPTYYSDYGVMKDLCAPGTAIMSTTPGNDYEAYSGTSMASPVVAAAAAMVLDANPDLTPDQVRNILCATARDIEERGFDLNSGYGIVDAAAAVAAAKEASENIGVDALEIKEDTFLLAPGESKGLETLVRPAASLAGISFSSADKEVAVVDAAGRVCGVAPGTTEITVHAGGKTQVQKVTVRDTDAPNSIELSSASLTGSDASINGRSLLVTKGNSYYIRAKVAPKNAYRKEVSFSSSNDAVVSVNDYQLLQARKEGTAKITARAYNGVSASFTVTVKKTAGSVKMTGSCAVMQAGDHCRFTAKVYDTAGGSDLAEPGVLWRSSNRRVAVVNEKTGEVYARKAGRVTIYAYAAATMNQELPVRTGRRITVAKKNYAGRDYRLRLVRSGKSRIKLSWKKIPLAVKYQVQRKAGSRGVWKMWKTIKGTRLTDYGLRAGKNDRYYRVRAVYKKNGQMKSFGWSKVVKAKRGK